MRRRPPNRRVAVCNTKKEKPKGYPRKATENKRNRTLAQRGKVEAVPIDVGAETN